MGRISCRYLSTADGPHDVVLEGPNLRPWPPFGLRFPGFFPTLLKKRFVRRNGLFCLFQPKCPCFPALFQLRQVLLSGVRANQLRFTKQDSKSVDGDIVWVRVPPPAPYKDSDLDTIGVLVFCTPPMRKSPCGVGFSGFLHTIT